MSANLPLLILAVALLWLPRGWMRRGFSLWRTHGRSRTSWTNPASGNMENLSFFREFGKPRNYYDFFRAFAGALVLIGGSGPLSYLQASITSSSDSKLPVLAVQGTLLLVGALLQTVRYERERWSLTAPVFYLAGISLVLFTPWPGLCGFVMAWLLTSAIPNAQGFLVVQAIVAGGVGVLLNGLTLIAILGFVLVVLPVVLGLLMNKPLIVFSRRGLSTGRSVNP